MWCFCPRISIRKSLTGCRSIYMDELGEDEPELGDDNDSAFEDDHPMAADDQYRLWATEDGSEEKNVFSSLKNLSVHIFKRNWRKRGHFVNQSSPPIPCMNQNLCKT